MQILHNSSTSRIINIVSVTTCSKKRSEFGTLRKDPACTNKLKGDGLAQLAVSVHDPNGRTLITEVTHIVEQHLGDYMAINH